MSFYCQMDNETVVIYTVEHYPAVKKKKMKSGDKWMEIRKILKKEGDQYRRKGRREGETALKMLEKTIRKHITSHLPKITYNT